MKLRIVFEPWEIAAKNMIWDERRLIVWDLAVYKLKVRSGQLERIYKFRKDLVCLLHRVRGCAIVVLSVFVCKVICGNCRTHAVLHKTDSLISVTFVR
jgi:hypothetical protein